MKISKPNAKAGLATILFLGYCITGLNSVSGQNMTMADNTTGSVNMTNATGSATVSPAMLHIGEAIKALESGNKAAASTHLTAAQQAVASESEQAKMHFNEAMKAFSLGDSNGALKHLNAANSALG